MRLLRMIIECSAPLHCGGGSDPILDQPVSRDCFGLWRIPGSSLAGSLRAMAHDLDKDMSVKLFGSDSSVKSRPSLVWCEDGLLLDFDGKPCMWKKIAGEDPELEPESFVRDHVAIDPQSGAAVEGGKFDRELVPPGARFLLEFRLDGWAEDLQPEYERFFDGLCERIIAGRLPLGGCRTNGCGSYRTLDYAAVEIDLKTAKGQEQWLNLPEGLPRDLAVIPLEPNKRIDPAPGLSGSLSFTLKSHAPILIGGGAQAPGSTQDADIMFATTPLLSYDHRQTILAYILPATSIRGVIRHAVYNVLTAKGAKNPEAVIKGMFGTAEADKSQTGKIIFRDAMLAKSKTEVVQHVKLDRFTGGAMRGALFNEAPVFAEENSATFRLAAKSLKAHEAALLFHALLDLFDGRLAFGNGVNRGNGRFNLPDWQNSLKGTLQYDGKPLIPFDLANPAICALIKEWDEALEMEIENERS